MSWLLSAVVSVSADTQQMTSRCNEVTVNSPERYWAWVTAFKQAHKALLMGSTRSRCLVGEEPIRTKAMNTELD